MLLMDYDGNYDENLYLPLEIPMSRYSPVFSRNAQKSQSVFVSDDNVLVGTWDALNSRVSDDIYVFIVYLENSDYLRKLLDVS
jgi:hypothetical protein